MKQINQQKRTNVRISICLYKLFYITAKLVLKKLISNCSIFIFSHINKK